MRLVIWMSARLGWGEPDGWLWTRISAVAPRSRPPADHFARVDPGLVDRAVADVVVVDQHVLGVQVEHPDPLDGEMGHVDRQVVDQRLPRGQHRLLANLRPGHPPRRQRDDVDRRGAGLAHSGKLGEGAGIGV